MTYKESYEKCPTEQELQQEVERDIYMAMFLGNNPDRFEQIRNRQHHDGITDSF